jgi:3-isopropylmalate/(R)-2-methylmalate dehydratase small subunit
VSTTFEGRVWKFGDDINTDLINPGFALHLPAEERNRHCFSANRPGWADLVRPGDVLVVGRNFGVGSARPIGTIFAELGIVGIVAESFNGLGLRSCINGGMPVLPCPDVSSAFEEGEIANVDWAAGSVQNVSRGNELEGVPLPLALRSIILAGGVEAVLESEGFFCEA